MHVLPASPLLEQAERELQGIDGANTAIAVIVVVIDENGEETLQYIECQVSVDETSSSTSDSPISPSINPDDVIFEMYLDPNSTYYFVVMDENGVEPEECNALVDFYYSTGGVFSWARNDSWVLGKDVCTWFGVTCEDEYVTGLSLQQNHLNGTIEASFGNLQYLQTLNLHYNELSGAIPSTITNLAALETLDISYNLLYTFNSEVDIFLDELISEWEFTQTVVPNPASIAFATSLLGTLEITWKPILYAYDSGFYRVGYAPAGSTDYIFVEVSGDKNTSSTCIFHSLP